MVRVALSVFQATYTNWYKKEPNNGGQKGGNEDCVGILETRLWSLVGFWKDLNCTLNRLPYICEKPAGIIYHR